MSISKVGRYQVIEEIGQGSMGKVYRGFDPEIQRSVAVKMIRHDFDPTSPRGADALRRMEIEARAAGGLSHPNLVTVYDVGEEQGQFYLVMEFIEGSSLDQRIKSGQQPDLAESLDIIAQICDGLAYAHGRGVVHRDIKAGNIMLSGDGRVRITDFGIARLTDAGLTSTGSVIGTPSYMSPEQAQGKKADGRSDLFSVGVLLFELLTGRKPFTGDHIAGVLASIVNAPHPSVNEIDPTLPSECDDILDRCLAKESTERYQSATDLARDIRRTIRRVDAIQTGTNLDALPDRKERFPWGLIPRLVAGVVAVTVITLMGVAALHLLGRDPARIRIQTNPVGAQVLLDNEVVGTAPLETDPVDPGLHKLQVQLEGYSPTEQWIEVEAGSVAAATFKLVPATARLILQSNPPDAMARLDGREIGRTPLELDVPAGAHHLELSRKGHAPKKLDLELQAGQEARRTIDLDTSAGTLRVRSNPSGATVLADGMRAGVTPMTISGVSPGSHRIEIWTEGYQRYFENVTVRDGQEAVVRADLITGEMSKVAVNAKPWGTVEVDGKLYGETPLTLELPPGQHTLKVLHPQFGEAVRQLNLKPGGTDFVSIDFQGTNPGSE